jgi:hypothetical protein
MFALIETRNVAIRHCCKKRCTDNWPETEYIFLPQARSQIQ